jgi:hypothetical protein
MLVRLLTAGVLVGLGAPMRTAKVGAMPAASPLARGDAAAGNCRTTNARHESIWLEPEMMVLLPALDGTIGHAELADLLLAAIGAGRLDPPADVDPNDRAGLAAAVAEQVPLWLDGLAEMGLLLPA